jgi:hypothetical protein
MLGETNTLEQFTVRAEEEEDRWGTRGYKYPQIQNKKWLYFRVQNLREKSRNFRPLKSLLTVARTVGTSEKKLGTSEQGNSRGNNSSRSLPFGCGLGFKKDRL